MAARNHKNHINLLPSSQFDQTTTGRILRWLLGTFRMIVIFVELIVIIAFLFRFWIDIQISSLNREIEEKKAIIVSFSEFEQEYRGILARQDFYKTNTENLSKKSDVLEKIGARVPLDLKLTEVFFDDKNKKVSISGDSLAEESISQYLTYLKTIPELSTISLVGVNTKISETILEFVMQTQTPIEK